MFCGGGINVKNSQEDRFIVSVKVGPKGQITIPVEARNMFDIDVGDTLMVMGDKNKGIALLKDDAFYKLMEEFVPDGSDKNK
ncbi:MAG: AbrB/MazE/SpoVT family DNA-binding domain-containing protein [Clostridia bacterium]|nr:AbrB/MazE/SpoVT family DNA-binding domain-containing protein [Clostridia bacterium]